MEQRFNNTTPFIEREPKNSELQANRQGANEYRKSSARQPCIAACAKLEKGGVLLKKHSSLLVTCAC